MASARAALAAAVLTVAPAAFAAGAPEPALVARFPERPISINGDLSDWSGADGLTFSGVPRRGDAANRCLVRAAWDDRRLYVAWDVRDTALHARKTEDSPQLYADDGVELFVDRGFQHGDRMDSDDFHVLVSIGGSAAVARGSDTLRDEQWTVPQEFHGGIDMVRFVRLDGTLNDDVPDGGYQVELSLRWEDIGGLPSGGETIGLGFCVDDRDGAWDVATADKEPHDIAAYEATSFGGVTDFGYPRDWAAVRLEGHIPLSARARAAATPTRLMIVACALLLVAAVYHARHRLRAQATLRRLRADLEAYQTVPAPPAATPATEPESLPAAQPAPPTPAPLPPVLTLPVHEPRASDRIVAYLQEHHASPLDMEAVARALGFSTKTMERLLKRDRATTYGALLTEIRMEQARMLLTRTERTVTEVAFDVGYSDSSYFTKVFRKKYGLTPSDLRRARKAYDAVPTVQTA